MPYNTLAVRAPNWPESLLAAVRNTNDKGHVLVGDLINCAADSYCGNHYC
jgi:hypothetical protein